MGPVSFCFGPCQHFVVASNRASACDQSVRFGAAVSEAGHGRSMTKPPNDSSFRPFSKIEQAIDDGRHGTLWKERGNRAARSRRGSYVRTLRGKFVIACKTRTRHEIPALPLATVRRGGDLQRFAADSGGRLIVKHFAAGINRTRWRSTTMVRKFSSIPFHF